MCFKVYLQKLDNFRNNLNSLVQIISVSKQQITWLGSKLWRRRRKKIKLTSCV